MAKFCGKCGSPLNELGKCPNCDATPVIQPEKTQAADAFVPSDFEKTQAADAFVQPTPQNNWQPQQAPAPSPKKKSKLPVFIIIAAAVVVLGALAFCAFFFHWFGLGKSGGSGGVVTSQTQAFVKTSYGNYVNALNISSLTEQPQNAGDLSVYDGKDYLRLYSHMLAQDGDTFYGRNGDKAGLYKMTVTGKNTGEIKDWVTEEQLKNSILAFGEYYARDIGYFIADGDYVYGMVKGEAEYRASHKELNNRLFRISKSGDKIEFVGGEDVRAQEFVLRDGWIYFYDNGYVTDGTTMDTDNSRVGLYKMKTDGSEKTKLAGDFGNSSEPVNNAYGALTLCGDKLYYLNATNVDSTLYRMNLDGSGVEQLCDQAVMMYTIDTQNNAMYFLTGKYNIVSYDTQKLCKLDLNSKQVTDVTNGEINTIPISITYDNGYLYLGHYNIMTNLHRRLELSTGKIQYIKYEQKSVSITICWADL